MSLLLGAERSDRDDESLLFSTSGVYSSASDSFVNSVEPSQCLRLSATAETVGGCKRALFSSAVQVTAASDDSEASAVGVSDDLLLNRDSLLPNREHAELLGTEKEWIVSWQSVSAADKPAESVADVSSLLSDSGVDSSTVSSHLCTSELSADSTALQQQVPVGPRRPFHSRSASDGGIFKPGQCFPNSSGRNSYLRRNYEQGAQ